MRQFLNTVMKRALIMVTLSGLVVALSAQSSGLTVEDTKKEIVATFGTFPSFYEAFPEHLLPGAWANFKAIRGAEASIDGKNRELIQLAVASQIPCDYCIYFHTLSAQAYGATVEEIKEAVALGAETRQYSMIIQGAQIDLEEFKVEFQEMMKHMAEQAAQAK